MYFASIDKASTRRGFLAMTTAAFVASALPPKSTTQAQETKGPTQLAKAPENKNAPKILNPESQEDKKMIDAIQMMYADKDFKLDPDKATLIYFSSETCGPCKILEPKIDQIKSKGLLSELNLIKSKTNRQYDQVKINGKNFPIKAPDYHGPLNTLSEYSSGGSVPSLLATYATPNGKFVVQKLDYYSNTKGSARDIVNGIKKAFAIETPKVPELKLDDKGIPLTIKIKTAE